jgi:hypothetical protein
LTSLQLFEGRLKSANGYPQSLETPAGRGATLDRYIPYPAFRLPAFSSDCKIKAALNIQHFSNQPKQAVDEPRRWLAEG